MKKTIAIIMCLMLVVAALAGCASTAPATEAPAAADTGTEEETTIETETAPAETGGDKVINLYSFTEEVPKMVEKYIEKNPDFGYTVNATVIATTDGLYQPAAKTRRTCIAANPLSC
jgi:ABC-type glycerol-3-phosphate transport system substrate-binding protein